MDGSQKVLLHPLVLLTASDLITRHKVRQFEGPVVGLLLGQRTETDITAEHAFTAATKNGLLDQKAEWTTKRIEQCELHSTPMCAVH